MPIYLVAAYAVFWLCTFVFVVSLWARQRNLEKDIRTMEERLKKTREAD